MINFETMHLALKCVIYPMTVYSTLFILLYIGKFFCVTIAEKAYKDIDSEGDSIHGLFAANIILTLLWWTMWFIESDFGTFLFTIFGAIIMLFNTIIIWLLVFSDGNPIIKFFVNLHRKIHERKHGRQE